MSPKRVIDGDVIHDPGFAAMTWVAQLLWYRLWDVADSWGLGVWDPLALKVDCFPLDKKVTDSTIKRAMGEIEGGCQGIGFYFAMEQRFFSLINWEEVVHPKHRKASWIPKPPKSVGQQMKLADSDVSTDFGQKPGHGIGIGIGIGIGTGAERPAGLTAPPKIKELWKQEKDLERDARRWKVATNEQLEALKLEFPMEYRVKIANFIRQHPEKFDRLE